ncbi:unnamed protein product [Amoebophrya sp. A120]|nr:unnamed protein product [Amoebophrya sp. A120]|eukprot:GSA120T00000699001.1
MRPPMFWARRPLQAASRQARPPARARMPDGGQPASEAGPLQGPFFVCSLFRILDLAAAVAPCLPPACVARRCQEAGRPPARRPSVAKARRGPGHSFGGSSRARVRGCSSPRRSGRRPCGWYVGSLKNERCSGAGSSNTDPGAFGCEPARRNSSAPLSYARLVAEQEASPDVDWFPASSMIFFLGVPVFFRCAVRCQEPESVEEHSK